MRIQKGDLTTITATEYDLLEVMQQLLNVVRYGGSFSFSDEQQIPVVVITKEDHR